MFKINLVSNLFYFILSYLTKRVTSFFNSSLDIKEPKLFGTLLSTIFLGATMCVLIVCLG